MGTIPFKVHSSLDIANEKEMGLMLEMNNH